MDEAGERPIYTAADPPRSCRNGHPFGPNRMIVNFWHCECSKVRPGHIGHIGWRCRTCQYLILADGHTDDSELFT